jgi:hypothetical protein
LVGELHLWNEQLPTQQSIGWGLDLRPRLERSLALLARFVDGTAALAELHMFAAEISLSARYTVARLDAVARRFGIHAAASERRAGPWARFSHYLHARFLRCAFPGPVACRGRPQRIRFWIARDELLAHHLHQPTVPAGRARRAHRG